MMQKIKYVILVLGVLIFFTIWLATPLSGLSRPAQTSIAIFVLCVALWITNFLPMSITGLIAIVAIPLLQVADSKSTFALFGSSAIFFILGAFILSTSLMKSGLSKRLAVFFLKHFDRNPAMLVLGVLVTTFFLAFWMPAHAVAALLFPIVLEITQALKLRPYISNLGKSLFLALAWGPVIGGVCTLLGGARNALAIEMLKDNYGLNIGFLEWMVAVIPVAAALLVIAYILLRLMFPLEKISTAGAHASLKKSVDKMGPLRKEEKKVAIIAILTIAAWIFLNQFLEIAVIALLSAISLFIFQAVNWRDVERYINWGIILMYGGAITLGSTLANVGAMDWVGHQIMKLTAVTPFSSVVLLSTLSKVVTEGISNVAAVATIVPLGFGLADTLNVNPVLIVYVIAVQSGLAFCLPIGTPPNAIAYSAGYYGIRDVLKGGIILNIAAILLFLLCVKFYWNFIGIHLI
jgi:sodium-dependent dicarboxylate transporter 2/3/5